jgi:pimeloyl-ACP methyl ester carboxylesterase
MRTLEISARSIATLAAVLLGACQSLPPPTFRQMAVNQTKLEILEQGEGETVVMVHGAISDRRIWEGQREAIAKKYRYVAYDQRYYGAAPWPDGGSGYSMVAHVDDLAALVQGLGRGPVHLVGWSYGSSVVLALAVRHPELVRSLFLYEPAAASATLVSDPAIQQALAEERKGVGPAVAAAKANDFPAAVRRFAEWVNNAQTGLYDRQPMLAQAVLMDNARTVPLNLAPYPQARVDCEQLRRIQVPTAVAKGQRTRLFFAHIADATARCIPGAKPVLIADSTHSAPIENPSGFNAAVLDFLARH